MSEDNDELVRAIRGLTIAVWATCVILIIWLGVWIWAYTAGRRAIGHLSSSGAGPRQVRGTVGPNVDLLAQPLDQKISGSSVILVTRFQPAEGRERAVITEILKKRPDIVFHYSVGDEYELLSHATGGGVSFGDGDVAFFAGSPPDLRGSYSYSRGRIAGLGDITLDQLRERVAAGRTAR